MLSAVYAIVVCLSVCLTVCVCLSHSVIVSKRLNVRSRKKRDTKVHSEIRTGSPPTGATNAGGVG